MSSLLAHHGALLGSSATPPAATTWDPALKGANVVLSNGDLDATKSGSGWQSVFGSNGKAGSGKHAFEITFLSGTGVGLPFASIADKTNSANLLTTYTGNNSATVQNSCGHWGNAKIYYRLDTATGETTVASSAAGSVITVALDLDAATPIVYFYKNGTLLGSRELPSGKTWFPVSSLQSTGSVRLAVTGLAHLPAGYSVWG